MHPEWADEGCFAAGIPGEFKFIYLPKRGIYDGSEPVVEHLEPFVKWHAFYFDPASGRKFDGGIIKATARCDDAAGPDVEFRGDVPFPKDWVLVLEKVVILMSREPSQTMKASLNSQLSNQSLPFSSLYGGHH